MISSQIQQDIVKISRGDEEKKNAVINLENRCLPDLESETIKNNKILKEVVNDRCQEILKRKCNMRHGLVVNVLGQKLMFRNEICSNITYWKLPVDCCINCTSNSNINSTKNKINCCSSSFHGRTNDFVQMQICFVYKCFEEELSANV